MLDIKELLDSRDAKQHDRATQEDPWVMYFVVNRDLNMSTGKIAAQVGHAAHILMLKYFETKQLKTQNASQKELVANFESWMEASFRKIVLSADTNKFTKLISEMGSDIVVVKDAGLTEIAPGSLTVAGVFPLLKSNAPRIIRKMQALK